MIQYFLSFMPRNDNKRSENDSPSQCCFYPRPVASHQWHSSNKTFLGFFFFLFERTTLTQISRGWKTFANKDSAFWPCSQTHSKSLIWLSSFFILDCCFWNGGREECFVYRSITPLFLSLSLYSFLAHMPVSHHIVSIVVPGLNLTVLYVFIDTQINSMS